MTEPIKLLEGLFDKKRMSLVRLFLDHPEQEYGIREAGRAARLAPATTYRIIRVLLKMSIIEERKIKKLRLYRLAQSRDVKLLDEMLAVKKSAMEEFTELVSVLDGVEEIILQGKPTKEKASVMVLGEGIDAAAMGRIVAEIREKYKFTVLFLALSRAQYEQMNSMGLYAPEKQTLFRK